jgi:hypothetical protein
MNESGEALRALREKLQELGEETTFADLGEPLLMDLALGWRDGVPFARHAAVLFSRIDGIAADVREREIAGRALLTILARRRSGVVPKAAAEHVRLLGAPGIDEGDPEAAQAFERREQEYQSLSELTPPYGPDEFARDAAAAFAAARARADEGRALPPDRIGPEHRLALLGLALPPGLRAHFHAHCGAERADAAAWKFVLVSKALARHGDAMSRAGVLRGEGTAVPRPLLEALLATDLGDLARTALYE